MKHLSLMLLGLFGTPLHAQESPLRVSTPEQLEWFSPPGVSALKGAWVFGADATPGAYLLRVRLAPDGYIPPHTHPDTRVTTILSGTLWIGYGNTPDPANMVAVPAGSHVVVPADTPHYVMAREGEIEYLEAGAGPTATQFVRKGHADSATRPSTP